MIDPVVLGLCIVLVVIAVVALVTNRDAAVVGIAILLGGLELVADLAGLGLAVATMFLLAVVVRRVTVLLVRAAYSDRISTQAWASLLDALLTSPRRASQEPEDRRGRPPDASASNPVARQRERDDDR